MQKVAQIDPQTGGMVFVNQQIDFQKLENEQKNLKLEVKKIFDFFPKTGLYYNESKDLYEPFIKGLMEYFKKQEGPRAELMNKIQSQLVLKQKELQGLLKQVLNLDFQNTNIKDIEVALVNFYPSDTYKQYKGQLHHKELIEQDIQSLKNSYSLKYRQIYHGLFNKHNDNNLCLQKISEILKDKEKRMMELLEEIQIFENQLKLDVKYQNYLQLMQILDPLLIEWQGVDKDIGKESNNKGNGLERFVEQNGIIFDFILNKIQQKRENVTLFSNVPWYKTAGEIDFIIIDKNDLKPLALIESKARCFDIAHGYRQSGPERDESKKQVQLNIQKYQCKKSKQTLDNDLQFYQYGGVDYKQQNFTEKVLIDVSFDIPCFVITVIPENDYHLGFESKLKTELTKYTIKGDGYKQEISNMDFKLLYNEILYPIFSKYISPQDFLDQYSDNVIILP